MTRSHFLITGCLLWVFLSSTHLVSAQTELFQEATKPRSSMSDTQTSVSPDITVLNVKDMNMQQLARFFSQETGWTVVVGKGALDVRVSAYFENIRGEDALRAICQAHNLWYRKDKRSGVVSIVTLDEYKKGMRTHSQDTVKVVTVLYPDARVVGDALQRLFSDRVVWNPPDVWTNDPIEDVERALERMDTLADRAQFSLSNPQGGGMYGGSGRSGSRRSGSGRSGFGRSSYGRGGFGGSRYGYGRGIGDTRSEGRIVEDIEREIESEALLTRLAEATEAAETQAAKRPDEPGIVYISAFRGTNDLLLRSSDPDSLTEIASVIKRLDKPKPQVLLEVKVLDILLDDDEACGVDWLFGAGDASGGHSTGINEDTLGTAYGKINRPSSPGLVPQGTGLDPKALILQVVTDEVLARIQLLEDRNRLVRLATPNLCVADGEASRVFVGTETTILKSVDVQENTTSGNNPVTITTYSPETDRQNVGTTLLITPRIHADRTATIRIVQEDSQVGEDEVIVYGPDRSFISQNVDTRSVTTTVVAADGKISAIGGLIREEARHRDVGVPGVMDLPYVGSVFKTRFETRERHELLVLIRPFILLAPGEAEPVSQDLMHRLSEHPSACGDIPALRIGEGSFTLVNERMYHIPKQAFSAIRHQATVWSTEEDGCNE